MSELPPRFVSLLVEGVNGDVRKVATPPARGLAPLAKAATEAMELDASDQAASTAFTAALIGAHNDGARCIASELYALLVEAGYDLPRISTVPTTGLDFFRHQTDA